MHEERTKQVRGLQVAWACHPDRRLPLHCRGIVLLNAAGRFDEPGVIEEAQAPVKSLWARMVGQGAPACAARSAAALHWCSGEGLRQCGVWSQLWGSTAAAGCAYPVQAALCSHTRHEPCVAACSCVQ